MESRRQKAPDTSNDIMKHVDIVRTENPGTTQGPQSYHRLGQDGQSHRQTPSGTSRLTMKNNNQNGQAQYMQVRWLFSRTPFMIAKRVKHRKVNGARHVQKYGVRRVLRSNHSHPATDQTNINNRSGIKGTTREGLWRRRRAWCVIGRLNTFPSESLSNDWLTDYIIKQSAGLTMRLMPIVYQKKPEKMKTNLWCPRSL